MSQPTIFLIDDQPSEAEEYQFLLGEASSSLSIEILNPPQRIDEVAALIANRDVAGFIIDHRLDALVQYDGTALASYLRGIRQDVPLFMLTSHVGDVEDHEESGSVDNVFPKDLVRDHARSLMMRIERRVGQYQGSLSERLLELSVLIDKKISGDIGESESLRLDQIRLEIQRPTDSYLGFKADQDREFLAREEALLARLEDLIRQTKSRG